MLARMNLNSNKTFTIDKPKSLYRTPNTIKWAPNAIESDRQLEFLKNYKPYDCDGQTWKKYVDLVTEFVELIKAYSPISEDDCYIVSQRISDIAIIFAYKELHDYILEYGDTKDINALIRPLSGMIPQFFTFTREMFAVCYEACDTFNLFKFKEYQPPRIDTSPYMQYIVSLSENAQTSVRVFMEACEFHKFIAVDNYDHLKIGTDESKGFTVKTFNEFYISLGEIIIFTYGCAQSNYLNNEQMYKLVEKLYEVILIASKISPYKVNISVLKSFDQINKETFLKDWDYIEEITNSYYYILEDLFNYYDRESSLEENAMKADQEFYHYMRGEPILTGYIK